MRAVIIMDAQKGNKKLVKLSFRNTERSKKLMSLIKTYYLKSNKTQPNASYFSTNGRQFGIWDKMYVYRLEDR